MKAPVTFSNEYPLCFDSKRQFVEWKATARLYPPPDGLSVCADCTPEYQKLMFKQCRCENPQVEFNDKGEPFVDPSP